LHYIRPIFFLTLFCTIKHSLFSQQLQFSLSTDFSVLRSFKKEQQFWSFGQTVTGHFHFTPKDGAYTWLTYYSNGSFSNQLSAPAKSPATIPAEIAYTNKAKMNFKHISFGWKHYFKNTSNAEEGWGIYGYSGLGLMLGRIENLHSVNIDTTDYAVPVRAGKANFKRLTVDLGLGYEVQLGGDVYLYLEGRSLVPLTDYPSNYIYINKYAPLTASANVGIRVLFD
jgi:hypothetical protein